MNKCSSQFPPIRLGAPLSAARDRNIDPRPHGRNFVLSSIRAGDSRPCSVAALVILVRRRAVRSVAVRLAFGETVTLDTIDPTVRPWVELVRNLVIWLTDEVVLFYDG